MAATPGKLGFPVRGSKSRIRWLTRVIRRRRALSSQDSSPSSPSGQDSPSLRPLRPGIFVMRPLRPRFALASPPPAGFGGDLTPALHTSCAPQIEAGNRVNGIFTSTSWKNLVLKFEEKSDSKRTKKQLKNKLDNMKKEYTWFMEFKNCTTGLGWNEAKQTVECSKSWWDEHLAVQQF